MAEEHKGLKSILARHLLVVVMVEMRMGGAFGGPANSAPWGLRAGPGDFGEVPEDCEKVPGVPGKSDKSPPEKPAQHLILSRFCRPPP